MLWLIFALLAALFFSLEHIISKKFVKNADPYYFIYFRILLNAIIFTPFIFILWHEMVFDMYAIIAFCIYGIIFGIAQFFYQKSLKFSDIGKTVPLLAITPLFTLVIAMFLVNEFPGLFGYLGIFLLVIGSYVLNIETLTKKDFLAPFKFIFRNKGSLLMFSVALIFGLTSVLDKYILNHASFFFRFLLLWHFTVIFQTVFLVARDKNKFTAKLKKIAKTHFWPVLLVVFVLIASTAVHLIALTMTLTAFVIAVKRIGIVFAVIMAFFIFKEKENFVNVLIGTLFMVVGVVLLVL